MIEQPQQQQQPRMYPYGEEFQNKVLALMLREPTFLAAHADVIDPSYFDSEYHASLATIVLDYYREHNTAPPTKDTIIMLIADYARMRKTDSTFRIALETILDRAINGTELLDCRDVQDRVVEFGNTRHLERMVISLHQQIQSGRPSDELWKLIDRTRNSCSGTGNLGIFLQDDILDAPSLLRANSMYDRNSKVAMFLPTFDEAFYGGLGRGELGIVMGYTNFGKSLFLVNLGAAAVFQQLPIVHFTVGELDEDDIRARYAARLSGTPLNELLSGDIAVDTKYRDRISMLLARYGLSINVKRIDPGSDVAVLRSHLARLRAERNFIPSLVLIDNADDLVATSKWGVADSTYEGLGSVYVELKSLAFDFQTVVWTDSQTNRSATTFEVADMDVIADSHKKARKADVVISVNQRVDERKEGTARLALIKARRYSKTNRVVQVTIDYPRMTMKEAPPTREEAAA